MGIDETQECDFVPGDSAGCGQEVKKQFHGHKVLSVSGKNAWVRSYSGAGLYFIHRFAFGL